MKKNIGTLDAYLRITCGLTMLGIGIIKSSKAMCMLGSMKVAEGVTKFCPMLHLLGLDTKKLDDKLDTVTPNLMDFEI